MSGKSYIESDGEARELDSDFFREARRGGELPVVARLIRKGRPPLPEAERKQRVTMYLDRDVLACLKQDGRGWQTRANERLREALGL